jgi:glycosyltransferase involved in cell wall biosynthesis
MDKIKKPLVSMRILTYNHEAYIEDALKAALSQTYSPLEIVVSDDKSQDKTVEIIERVVSNYKGKHTVIFNKNLENLGISGHLSKVIEMCSGELHVGAAGDDISLPNRVEVIVDEWLKSNKKNKSFFSNAIRIDQNGEEIGKYFSSTPVYARDINDYLNDKRSFREKLGQPLVWQLGASQAFEKSLYSRFGRPHPKALQEDGIYAFRGILSGGVKYIDQPLVKYREHSHSISYLKSYKTIQKLKIKEPYYRLTQLNDAKHSQIGNKRLIRKAFISYQLSRIIAQYYKVNFLAFSIYNLKNMIKKFI